MKGGKGLTLMELTIVLAIIVIIAAIIVPVFLLTTDRSRLRADIQSARTIQNAIELYRVERRTPVGGSPDNVPLMITNLINAGYLRARNAGLQTENATWTVYDGIVMVNIGGTPPVSPDVQRAYGSLPPEERAYVRGGVLPAATSAP